MPPRYTIIIPAAQFAEGRPALAGLAAQPPPGGAQILVALGRHPARQRNAALSRATGAVVVFLDNDVAIGAGYWDELERAFAQPAVEVVGGPALLRVQATPRERIFQALLTHPLVVGPLRARYAAVGIFRRSSQRELILCNLAVRRDVFERVGQLPVDLYPNEENEWLDRAQAARVGIYYDPALQIFRPQRETWGAMARTLVRYGIGRTRQLQISRHLTAHQLAPLALLAPAWALEWGAPGLVIFGVGWLLVALFVGLTCESDLRPGERIAAGLAAPFVPILYAWGQVMGWFVRGTAAVPEITLVDETGRPVEG